MAGSLELMSGSNQQQPDSVNPYANTDFAKASQGDLSNGRWGIDNWFRNLFSFGDYDKQRDAAYQLYLNNTAMQRAKADSEKAGINPLYSIGNLQNISHNISVIWLLLISLFSKTYSANCSLVHPFKHSAA